MCCASACSPRRKFAAESVLRRAALTHTAARKKVSSTSAGGSTEVGNFIKSHCVTLSDYDWTANVFGTRQCHDELDLVDNGAGMSSILSIVLVCLLIIHAQNMHLVDLGTVHYDSKLNRPL